MVMPISKYHVVVGKSYTGPHNEMFTVPSIVDDSVICDIEMGTVEGGKSWQYGVPMALAEFCSMADEI